MISLECSVAPSQDVIWRLVDDEVFIINEDGETIHVLNRTGGFIWELCEQEMKVADIVERVCERFEVSPEQAEADTVDLLEQMFAKNILNRK
ncbi:PqqD family protein [Thermodesulfobacteriota bacterium]